MTTKHTPEPWRARAYANGQGEIWIDCDAYTKHGRALGGTLATALDTGCGEGGPEANARRIVACVNACAGIPTRDLVAAVERFPTDRGAVLRMLAAIAHHWSNEE